MPQALKTIALDAFGTAVYIANPTNVYRWFLDATGTALTPAIKMLSMTEPMTFDEYARRIAPDCPSEIVQRATDLLDEELASVTLFADTIPTLRTLRERGFEIAIVSNLAAPYAVPLKRLLSGLIDHWCLSFEIGAMKPDAAIFDALLQRTGHTKEQVLMIGDRMDRDVIGAHRAGIQAMLLDRSTSHEACRGFLYDLNQLVDYL